VLHPVSLFVCVSHAYDLLQNFCRAVETYFIFIGYILEDRNNWHIDSFYRAMHFSAKRGLAIACRPSVRPYVTLVDCDHIGWYSSELT